MPAISFRRFAGQFRFAALLGLSFASLPGAFGQTTLSVSDIQVTGVTSDANDSFTFVLWKDITANTVIRFMDQSFTNATTGLIGTETDMSLTFNTALTAGTVIRVEDTGTTLVNGGTFNGTKTGSLSGISADGDQVFIYQGTAVGSSTSFTGRTLLYGVNISTTSWATSGINSNTSFLPNAINSTDANLDTDAFENADYSGVRSGLTTAFYRAAVGNLSNYTQSNTRSNLATGGFTIASSASVTWDNNGETSGTGGTGIWDSATKDKWSSSDNSTFFRWVNPFAGTSHNAVFAGTAGTVSVASGGVTASGLQFNVSGYTIQNNSVTLSGTSTPTIQVTTSGHTATITAALSGTQGFTKTGNGTLQLTANNSISGTVSVTAGTLQLSSTTTNQALGQATSISVSNGTLLLGASDEINNTADLTLGTGGIFNLAGFSEGSISADGLGALILTGNATLDFGTAAAGTSILRFDGVGTRSGKLSLIDYDIGTDRLLFSGVATDPGSFGSAYGPSDISFNGVNGFNAIQFGGYYEIVPVPEPATILGASALLGLVAWRERRRWLGRRVGAAI